MVIHMYIAPGQGQTTLWAQTIFININLLSICSFLASFLPLNDIFLFFSHSNAWAAKVDLAVKRSRSSQGHDYTNLVELHCLMLHAKFQNHRPSGSEEGRFLRVFAIYSHGGHLGHVTLTIYTKLSFTLPKNAPHKVWL